MLLASRRDEEGLFGPISSIVFIVDHNMWVVKKSPDEILGRPQGSLWVPVDAAIPGGLRRG
jgi:hypothetical protein